MRDHLSKYVRYNLWANARIIDLLNAITDEQIDQVIINSFPSVKKTIYHIWGGQQVWLKRLHGYSPTVAPNKDFAGTFKEATDSLLHTSEELIEFLDAANEEVIRSVITYKAFDGTEYKSNISDVIQHVVNHSTFHRGQIITMLRQLGQTKFSSTDYIAWCRE